MPESPYLTIDLDRVRENLQTLRAALPGATIRYAVKANPAEPILRLLAAEGVAFDVASVGEIDACDSAGIDGRLAGRPPGRAEPGDVVETEPHAPCPPHEGYAASPSTPSRA